MSAAGYYSLAGSFLRSKIYNFFKTLYFVYNSPLYYLQSVAKGGFLPLPRKQKSSKSLPEAQPAVRVPVFLAAPESGLSEAQVAERVAAGLDNRPVDPPRKTAGQIVKENVFTYFNMLFFLLALCVIAVGQWLNLTFMGVVFCNTIIGTIQDLRAQRKLDKLNILAAAEFGVVRNGTLEQVTEAQLVRDDIVLFDPGCQICADAEVVSGECRVNEALVTGESDEIVKKPSDSLLSGSFVVSGGCRARLTAVGADSFVSKLTIEAKKAGKQPKSEMMRSLTSLIKWIGFLVIPLGVLMFIKEYRWLDRDVVTSVISTVGSIVGMIPEGLYLLTSLALVASIIRLAGRRTLVHDMDCIETLARVDTLCVDKTGTITEPAMIVDDIVPLTPDRFCEDDIRSIMADYVSAMQSDNDTMIALKQYFDGTARRAAQQTLPFSSAKKYGGVQFHSDEVYLLGAPDILLASQPDAADTLRQVEEFSAKGCRVLLLGLYEGGLNDDAPTAPLLPLSLVLLSNKIREAAPDTFAYFARQGVAVKVISGDNALTVSEVARRAGIEGAENYVDARTLQTEKQLAQAAERCTVFGRVTPDQKKQLVQAMKAAGHTVAMTGDGVNDVLALREADCSIAMASGSSVACQASHIVLLDSDFSAMPSVVAEGRRVINNIERSASLYLVKNIFTFILAITTLIFTLPYPYSPAQLSLVNAITIGIPSFILAMEPNEDRISGHFLGNVLRRALPAALADYLLVLGVMLFYLAFHLEDDMLSTISTGVMGVVGLMMVFRTSKPFNTLRIVMMSFLIAAFTVCYFFFPTYFTIEPLNTRGLLVFIVFALLACSVFWALRRFGLWISEKLLHRKSKRNQSPS